MTHTDTARVNRWRVAATVVLLLTAVAVTATTYSILKKEEAGNFDTGVSQKLHGQPDAPYSSASVTQSIYNYALARSFVSSFAVRSILQDCGGSSAWANEGSSRCFDRYQDSL